MTNRVSFSNAVQEALEAGKPVVALESTIISHGMPYPENLKTALRCEAIVREQGAEPATVAVLSGRLCAGLVPEQLEQLSRAGTRVRKASRRDLPILAARGMDGATTVSATMIIAALAGISVFATGGIGGVHRGAETSMDVSADLEELARTPVAVVCAGPKAILDISLTLEYLETKGVPVIGYQTDELPAFYSDRSGFAVDYRMETPEEIADAIRAQREIGYSGGMLVCNPIPREYALDPGVVEHVITDALREAKALGIRGKETTPFLLKRVSELTAGDSLASNIRLVYHNAGLAARIASALGDIHRLSPLPD